MHALSSARKFPKVSKPVYTDLTDPQVGRLTWASEMQRFLKDSCSWACCLSLLAMGLETVLINRLAKRGDGLSKNRKRVSRDGTRGLEGGEETHQS